jgi:hypothetical protein
MRANAVATSRMSIVRNRKSRSAQIFERLRTKLHEVFQIWAIPILRRKWRTRHGVMMLHHAETE